MFCLLWQVLSIIGCIYCNTIYDSNMNLVKPRFEINKVNKGIWLRHKEEVSAEKTNGGNFIFRANSLDTESNIQNAFDSFALRQEGMSDFTRNKRSPNTQIKPRYRKSITNNTKANLSDTPSLFNKNPYEVTVLLDNENNKNIDFHMYPKYETGNMAGEKNYTLEDLTSNDLVDLKTVEKEYTNHDSELQDFKDVDNATEGNISTPKRSMNYVANDINRINLLESINHGKVNPPFNFLKGDKRWQTAPVPKYNGVPKEPKVEDPKTPKPITERGLIKVLSMLTKTFKKIMKQHNDIKIMHTQMQSVNDEFRTNVDMHTKKLQDFDIKYLFFLNIIEKLKTLQDKLRTQEETYRKKDEQLSRNLVQFENQQKKFLTQQQQFFNIQKLILAQNEKINQKQNTIAKTQTEVSHRQNNFARVLEKAKKVYGNSKLPILPNENVRPKNSENNISEPRQFQISQVPTTTESITINLFSIPASNPIENQDRMILNEKDDRPVDELIYKYYFNNTFIDTIIKNKILSGFYLGDRGSFTRNAKHKRNYKPKITNLTSKATVLLPIHNTTVLNSAVKRVRRWINHHSKIRHRRKHNGKGSGTTRRPIYREDETTKVEATTKANIYKVTREPERIVNPYVMMATRFCTQIGQNKTKQVLDWCVEKALRRLKNIDSKFDITQVPTKMMPKIMTTGPITTFTRPVLRERSGPISSQVPTSTATISTTASPLTSGFTQQNNPSAPRTDGFFPDNEELELNLKQFDITKDVEGNVYYDGSMHESDLVGDKSRTISDFLPEFDSDSKVELDTKALQLQSLRHMIMNDGARKRDPRL